MSWLDNGLSYWQVFNCPVLSSELKKVESKKYYDPWNVEMMEMEI